MKFNYTDKLEKAIHALGDKVMASLNDLHSKADHLIEVGKEYYKIRKSDYGCTVRYEP